MWGHLVVDGILIYFLNVLVFAIQLFVGHVEVINCRSFISLKNDNIFVLLEGPNCVSFFLSDVGVLGVVVVVAGLQNGAFNSI